MSKHKYTVKESVRMVGHLLEHHPATTWFAFNKEGHIRNGTEQDACCWCLAGALSVISHRLKVNYYDMVYASRPLLGYGSLSGIWDGSSDEGRLEIARKLQKYGL